MPGVQRQLGVIRFETERAVSPPLVAELRRILPSHDSVPSGGALRIECAVLASWVEALVVQMLAALRAAHERSQQVSARCPVRAKCLDYALEHSIKHGVWGGFNPEQRARERRRRAGRSRAA